MNQNDEAITDRTLHSDDYAHYQGTPQPMEMLIDSKREVDKQLKINCENFIKYVIKDLIGLLTEFMDKVIGAFDGRIRSHSYSWGFYGIKDVPVFLKPFRSNHLLDICIYINYVGKK